MKDGCELREAEAFAKKTPAVPIFVTSFVDKGPVLLSTTVSGSRKNCGSVPALPTPKLAGVNSRA
jgi:hypothetical protein